MGFDNDVIVFGDDVVVLECSLRKKRLPDGRSSFSSFRVKAPSLVCCFEGEVGVSSLGGEWSLMKESPYFSDCKERERDEHGLYLP